MKVYKVVERQRDGTLTSLIVYGKAEKHYIPNATHCAPAWLARQGYHITAFDKQKHARAFRDRYRGEIEVWRCEATDIIHYKSLPGLCFISDLWDGILTESPMRWPEGAVMCKTIKLLEKVT